jgi:dTDP-4-amino-4,6-dideoxygalactose transaminase
LKVPLFAVEKLSREVRAASIAAFERVFDGGNYILGPEVSAFEAEVAKLWRTERHCIGVSNGTDALVCALASLGIEPGHHVLTTPLTFFATISAIRRLGAIPVFCDVDERTFNLDVTSRLLPTPAAVVAVHLFGRPADVGAIRRECPGIPVVEDAAQSLGAEIDGQQVGALGELAAFSFFPTKPLGGCGDGGLVVTPDAELAARCRAVRSHGRSADEGTFGLIGGNYRLDAVQAALLGVRLAHVADWHMRRRANANYYLEALHDVGELVLPMRDTPTNTSAWSVFALRAPGRRDALRSFLTECGIGTAVYYPRAAHLQAALGAHQGREGQFPVAERLTGELLAIPIGPELSSNQREYVVDSIRRFFVSTGHGIRGATSQ